jgi:integrase
MGERARIGLQVVKALGPGQVVWDLAVSGFGARRQRSEVISYFLFYRHEGRQRWHTIGRHGSPWTPDTARGEARRLLGEVARGEDPAGGKQAGRAAMTVAHLCDEYLQAAEAGRVLKPRGGAKKGSTLAIDRGRIERHVKPLIGKLKVAAVTRNDIQNLLHDVAAGRTAGTFKTGPRGLARVRGGKGAANRAVRLLGGIFTYAVKRGICASNPVRGVDQYVDGQRTRRLNESEYRALGRALRKAEIWPPAVAAVRFIALTGWRSGEVLALRRGEFDVELGTAWLPDSKTGRSMRPLAPAACALLRDQHHHGALVFPPTHGDGLMGGFKKHFRKVAALAKLEGVSAHTLRHSFASVAADLGYSDLTIGALIGHRGRSMTSRYSHSTDKVLIAAADTVANHILGLMGDSRAAEDK